MIVPEYTPGDWHAVVAGGVVALLAPTTPTSVVRAVWDAVPAHGGLADQLEVLLTDGIARLQPFALVDLTGGRVHAALRGPVEVEVVGQAGASVLAAGEVTTWSERVAEGADVVTVRVTGTGAVDLALSLPVVSGVVRAAAVRVPLASHAPDPVPAAVEATQVEPVVVAVPVAASSTEVDDEPEPAAVGADRDGLVTDVPVVVADLPVPAEALAPQAEVPESDVPAPVTVPSDDEDAPTEVPAPEVPVVDALDAPVPVGLPEPPEPFEAFDVPTLVDEPLDAPADAAPDAGSVGYADDENAAYGAEVVAAAEAVLHGQEHAPQLEQDFADDHDGLTILSSDLVAIRDQLPSWASDEVPGPFRVLAPEVAPPAKLVLSTGQVVALDRAVLLGRAPQVARVTNRELPRLVTVPSPQQDISRTHAEVRSDGDDVLVTDLNSTNGILVARAGERARRLHPGEPTVVAVGEVVDLGDGITFTVERGA